jgi:hypothetical protein
MFAYFEISLADFLSSSDLVAGNVVTDERAVSQQVQFGNVPFSIISSRMHGCTTVSRASS